MEALTEAFSHPGAGRLYWCGYGSFINETLRAYLLLLEMQEEMLYLLKRMVLTRQ